MSVAAVPAASISDLGQQVLDLGGTPMDQWEIAAQLEVMGLRDADARSDYGARDLFDLARQIYERWLDGGFRSERETEDAEERLSPVARFVRNYITGLSFSLPMALQAAVMLLWGYGVWGAVEMDLRTGTAIALGFIGSYVATGGFMQAIVRRGLFYIYQQEEWLARWAVLRTWWLALQVVLGLLVPALLLNALFGALPWSIVLLAAGYYVGLSILWLNWSLIYLVRQTWLFLLTTAVALGVVLIAAKVFGLDPVPANAAGLIVADVLSFALAIHRLNRLARTRKAKETITPPRLTVLVHSTSRFFLYGLLYNTFLFADRVIAWTSSTGREDFPPYGFWMNVRYELGMDLALVVVMVLAGIVEHAARRFSEELIPMEKRVKSADAGPFFREAARNHRRHMVVLAIASIFAVGIAILVAVTLRGMTSSPIHASLISPTTARVFVLATVAYVLFLFALQNVLMLLTLSRVDLVVRAVGVALAVNVATGFVLSRAVHYSAAVTGFLAGSAVLLFLTARSMRRVLGALDYYYYAAY